MEELLERFRKNLKDKIEDKEYSQREFAKLLGCDQTSISKWINAKAEPKLSNILKILEVFDCDFYEFFKKDK